MVLGAKTPVIAKEFRLNDVRERFQLKKGSKLRLNIDHSKVEQVKQVIDYLLNQECDAVVKKTEHD